MTVFTELVEFIRSEQSGTCWDDVTYRAYDLDRATGESALKRALRTLGRSWAELRSDLVQVGLRGDHKGAVIRWSIWRRLAGGDIMRWPLRSSAQIPPGNGGRSDEKEGRQG